MCYNEDTSTDILCNKKQCSACTRVFLGIVMYTFIGSILLFGIGSIIYGPIKYYDKPVRTLICNPQTKYVDSDGISF